MGFACFSAGYWDAENPGPKLSLPAALGCCFQDGTLTVPKCLPKGCLLVLDDREAYRGNRPEEIAAQLGNYLREHHCQGLLLDFEREPESTSLALARALGEGLPCPVIASPPYAQSSMGVFLPPLPLTERIQDYVTPWKGREIWLDLALQKGSYAVDASGCRETPWEDASCPFTDEALHVQYGISVEEAQVLFHIKRDLPELSDLIQEAEALGITHGITLYTEIDPAEIS